MDLFTIDGGLEASNNWIIICLGHFHVEYDSKSMLSWAFDEISQSYLSHVHSCEFVCYLVFDLIVFETKVTICMYVHLFVLSGSKIYQFNTHFCNGHPPNLKPGFPRLCRFSLICHPNFQRPPSARKNTETHRSTAANPICLLRMHEPQINYAPSSKTTTTKTTIIITTTTTTPITTTITTASKKSSGKEKLHGSN